MKWRPGGGGALALPLRVLSHHCNSAVPAPGILGAQGPLRTWADSQQCLIYTLNLEGRWGKVERSLGLELGTEVRGPVIPWAGHITSDL